MQPAVSGGLIFPAAVSGSLRGALPALLIAS